MFLWGEGEMLRSHGKRICSWNAAIKSGQWQYSISLEIRHDGTFLLNAAFFFFFFGQLQHIAVLEGPQANGGDTILRSHCLPRNDLRRRFRFLGKGSIPHGLFCCLRIMFIINQHGSEREAWIETSHTQGTI